MRKSDAKLVRIPMRHIDGKWEFELGGNVAAAHGTIAELVVSSAALSDRELVKQLLSETRIRILDQGTSLRMFVVTGERSELSEVQRKVLISWRDVESQFAPGQLDNWSSKPPSLIEIALSEPSERQLRVNSEETGGLWLRLEGTRAIGLISSTITLPAGLSSEPAISLNHAFTILSEIYEPWRKSHTGNVYTRTFYRESDGLWHPLELLRDAQIAEKEQRIAHDLWRELLRRMSSSSGAH